MSKLGSSYKVQNFPTKKQRHIMKNIRTLIFMLWKITKVHFVKRHDLFPDILDDMKEMNIGILLCIYKA